MTFTPEQNFALHQPLERSHVATREQSGKTLSYIEAWHAIAEANRIFGFDGWTRETVLLEQSNRDLVELTGSRGAYQQWRVGYVAKVRIVAGGVVREGTGFGSGMAKPEALGDAIESAVKEAESDAMKRALMTFGNPFGLALYDKSQSNVAEAPNAADFAITAMRTAHTPDEFREFWAKNKDGLKDQLTRDEYARVVGAMQEEAKRFAPKRPDFPGDQTTPFDQQKEAA